MATNGITGVILAGGLSTHMGGEDKGLLQINHKPLYCYVADRLAPQVAVLMINANRNEDVYQHGDFPVVADTFPGFAGPLAGTLTGLRLADSEWVAFVPCDVPVFPNDLVARLWENDSRRPRPLPAMIKVTIIPRLRCYTELWCRRWRRFCTAEEGGSEPVPDSV